MAAEQPIWYKLYIGQDDQNPRVSGIHNFVGIIDQLKEKIKEKEQHGLAHADASRLDVYPAGTVFPSDGFGSVETVPANTLVGGLFPFPSFEQPLIVVAPKEQQPNEPPKKKIRSLQDSTIIADTATRLSVDSEKMLNPLGVKTIKYFGRAGMAELFELLVNDQTGEEFFNISLVGPPGTGKSNLVFAAAENIAYAKKKNVLWVGRRFQDQNWKVKLFSANLQTSGDLFVQEVLKMSLEAILQLPLANAVSVLIVDAPTKANSANGQAGTAAFEWAGTTKRINGRRVIHVSSLGRFADKQTIRDEVNLRDVQIPLFTREEYIKSLSDPDLKKAVCKTLGIDDVNSVSNGDVVDRKFFYSGINARWFFNRSIEDIKEECTEIIERLDGTASSTGTKDCRAVNSAVTTIRGERLIHLYTSCYLAKSIGSNKGSYHSEFLRLFPFVEHTLGAGTPGDIFESDFRFHLEQCHSLRDAQVAIMGNNAEDVMVFLGKCGDDDSSKLWLPAGEINALPGPPADIVAFQRAKLTSPKRVPQWFIPESKTQPFLDFLVLIPTSANKWLLKVIQNTIGGKHSAEIDQLKRVIGGLVFDGFILEETITVVYVIEDRNKSGKIAAALHGARLDVEDKKFKLEVVHSVYPRFATVPK